MPFGISKLARNCTLIPNASIKHNLTSFFLNYNNAILGLYDVIGAILMYTKNRFIIHFVILDYFLSLKSMSIYQEDCVGKT